MIDIIKKNSEFLKSYPLFLSYESIKLWPLFYFKGLSGLNIEIKKILFDLR